MERNFENLRDELLKAIKHCNFAVMVCHNEISSTTNKQKIKLAEKSIDRDFHAMTEMELVLRKFYTWDEIHDLENN